MTVLVHAGSVTGQIILMVQGAGSLAPPVIDGFVPFNNDLHRSGHFKPPSLRRSTGSIELDVHRREQCRGQEFLTSYAAPSGTSFAVTTNAPALALSNAPLLSDGPWHVTVTASNSAGTSAPLQGDFILVGDDLSSVRIFPNPWRRSRDLGVNPVHFDPLPASVSIKIFSVSGHLVRDLGTVSGTASWDVKNDDGDFVASGIYLYLITDGQGTKDRGKIVVIQ